MVQEQFQVGNYLIISTHSHNLNITRKTNTQMKSFTTTLIFMMVLSFCAIAQEIILPLGGNAYSNNPNGGRFSTVRNKGIQGWRNPSETFTIYYRAAQPGDLKVAVNNFSVSGNATIAFEINGKTEKMNLNESTKEAEVGTWKIKDTGYVAIKLSGISKTGEQFPAIENLVLSGKAVGGNVVYVKDNTDNLFHFGRRGPSTHLNYQLPKDKDIEWFYNEVTIPEGQDPIGTYYMANGFGEGYFGMQVNSASERRILFSVWSPFNTDNPKEIPAEKMIKLIKKGEDVRGGEFGGEGSGGQSIKIFNWKAGNTYKFLLRVRPVADNYTEYTAYFFAPETNQWQLIACFQRPQIQTYAKRLHSFLECFSPNMGNVTRIGTYGNQWVCDANGNWIEITKARFSHDATAAKGYRKDYQGGVYENGNFYLKIDGFFNDFTPYGKTFERKPTNRKPNIDFSKLP